MREQTDQEVFKDIKDHKGLRDLTVQVDSVAQQELWVLLEM
jgi:hypothetical protein